MDAMTATTSYGTSSDVKRDCERSLTGGKKKGNEELEGNPSLPLFRRGRSHSRSSFSQASCNAITSHFWRSKPNLEPTRNVERELIS
jgi:hypothetical protein